MFIELNPALLPRNSPSQGLTENRKFILPHPVLDNYITTDMARNRVIYHRILICIFLIKAGDSVWTFVSVYENNI